VDDATAARFWRGLAASNMYGYVAMTEQLEAAQRAAALYRTMGRPKRLFSALRRTFVWAIQLQDDVLANSAMEASEGLIQRDWGPEFRIEVLRSRSHLASWRGDYDAAIALRQEAVRVARDDFGDWRLQIIEETCAADLLWCAGRHAEAADLLSGLIEAMRLRPASDYELLDAIETQLWILSDLGDLPAASALARQALPVMRRMPRFSLSGCAHLLMRLGGFQSAARVLGAQIARTRAGLAPTLPPGLSALDRLQADARAGVEAALAPADVVALLNAGEALGHGEICNLLAAAVLPEQVVPG
jgi:tetratricopeptide (TPR) repeat protein